VIVDLPVKSDPQITSRVAHRLVPALNVDYGQPPLAEVGPRIVIEAEVVRSSMPNRIGHATQDPNGAGLTG
jgi:hypothetical protein